ncbi:MAG: fibronectin type III domain-containing protein [Clostridia bacterium]|nr:fibronectin type III domain-containing protein [Clostridia bacterium]
MKKKMTKVLAMLMCIMTAVAFMPAFAFAADGGVSVKITVSGKGELALDNSGNPVAAKSITVTDRDGDGSVTLSDAFITAHEKFNSKDNYSISNGYCSKFWGDTSGNYLGFVNGSAGGTAWNKTAIKDGDYIVASINKDYNGNDYYTAFDKNAVTVKTGESFSLKLSGHNGMAGGADKAVSDVSVKTSAGTALGKTNSNGTISMSFSKAGSYVVTAAGFNVDTTVTDAWIYPASKKDKDGKTIYATADWNTGEEAVLYYTSDPGEAPYDSSLMYAYSMINIDKFDPETFNDGFLLYSNEYKASAPAIAPACVVTVKAPAVKKPVKPAFKLKAGKKVISVTMSKSAAKYNAAAFQIAYKKTGAKKWKSVKTKNAKKTIKKLKRHTKYSFKVRTYKKVNGKYYYSSYTTVKRIKTK